MGLHPGQADRCRAGGTPFGRRGALVFLDGFRSRRVEGCPSVCPGALGVDLLCSTAQTAGRRWPSLSQG